jgi:N-acetylglucosaminylphosphatidylinositol deacetylase
MLRQISFSLLAIGFLVQVLAVLLSSPYAPQDFAKRRTLALLSRSADTDASESRIVKPKIHHVLLLTAHPDDEAMFFGPTLVGMNVSLLTTPGKTEPVHETASKLSPKVEIPESFVQKDRDTFVVYSLCLSPGGTPGSELAERRKREIGMSLERLGVPPERRWVLNTP